MIILLLCLCTQLGAVNLDIVPLGTLQDPYQQIVQVRASALAELHPEPRDCQEPYCIASCNPEATRRLFPPEQDPQQINCDKCYAVARRSGCGFEHCVCCCSIPVISFDSATAIFLSAVGPWWLGSIGVIAGVLTCSATVSGIKCAKELTKKFDTDVSARNLLNSPIVPVMQEHEELDTQYDTSLMPIYTDTSI